ncbi:hypothetical protein QJS10_CPA02g01235 [Acorus calamus]|uniref:WD repeat-containing protein 76 n=1 Tax=Acorus calamus TaxID=4465 RepID=A0AAV9FB91_ACOCL|nr:hypothetical protein QJS10_CPA02g01235 [Acorus calamus]
MASKTLTEYERKRLENIKRNDEMIASLMLQHKAADLSSSIKRLKPQIRPLKRHSPEKNNKAPVVIRRSLRARGIPPDAAAKGSPPPPPSPAKSPSLTIRDASSNAPGKDRRLFETVARMCENAPLSPPKRMSSTDGPLDLRSLKLEPEHVARIISGRIMTVQFFPFVDRRVVAVGSKLGKVSFWDVDRGLDGGDDADDDGVYLYDPHTSPVSGISIQPFSLSKVLTSSYDGFIRSMDVEKETFNMSYSGDDAIYSLSQRPLETNVYFGEGQGGLKVWDERAGKVLSSYSLHEKRINTIDFSSCNANLMATSSTDGTACIWDLRKISNHRPASLRIHQHEKAVHSAYFSPSGSCLATTSIDNRIGILSGDNFMDVSMIRHDNQTGRWLSSFRVIWGWDDSYVFVGNMKRAVDVISTVKKTTKAMESPLMTAIPCRFAAHPYRHGTLASTTSGGQIYMWTSI